MHCVGPGVHKGEGGPRGGVPEGTGATGRREGEGDSQTEAAAGEG